MLDTLSNAAVAHDFSRAGGLVSYSLAWPETDLLEFLKQGATMPRLFWENAAQPLSFAGYGLAATLTAHGTDRFAAMQEQVTQLFTAARIEADADVPTEIGPRLFGGFSFRPTATTRGIWSAFPSAHFMLPTYQLTHLNGQTWLTVNHCLSPGEDIDAVAEGIRANVQSLRLALELVGEQQVGPLGEHPRPDLHFDLDYPMDQQAWHRLISETTRRIKQGELKKAVLARVSRVRSSRVIDPVEMLAALKKKYANCYRFALEPIPGHAFYGATPELLAEVEGATLRSTALAGSIARGDTPDKDAALGQELLDSTKDRQEHAFVVEMLRDSLQPLLDDIHIPETPSLLKLSNIQHLETHVSGTLKEPQGVLPVVEQLHPTPAMGGSPREVALQLIAEGEPFSRGWYASPVGWIDAAGNGLFAVAIRSAVSVGHDTCVFAGAGIVADSEPQKEWQETGLKFRPILDALKEAASDD